MPFPLRRGRGERPGIRSEEPAIGSIKDIAREAGVSIATVSRIVNNNGYASPETRARVLAAVKKHGYSPNLQAINLLKGRSDVVGLIVPQIDNAFFIQIIIEVEGELRRRGYNVMLCHTGEDEELEGKFLEHLSAQRVAGIIATPVGVNSAHYRPMVRHIPTVIIARHFRDLAVSRVDLDNYGASYNVVRHLAEQNHRRIMILYNEERGSTNVDRLQGVRDAARDGGLGRRGLEIVSTGLRFEEAHAELLSVFRRNTGATAVFALYLVQAIAAMRALAELGISVPEEMALTSFNDMGESPYSGLMTKQLTGNRHPTREICLKAVDFLLDQIREREKGGALPPIQHAIYPLELMVKESSLHRRPDRDGKRFDRGNK